MADGVKTLGGAVTVSIAAGVVLGQQNGTLTLSADMIDTSVKADFPDKNYVANSREWSIDFDGILMSQGTGSTAKHISTYIYSALTGTVLAVIFTSSTDTYTGSAYMESADVEAPQDKEGRYKFKLKGTGALTIVASGLS